MTLSDRIAALSAPDRAMDAEIAAVLCGGNVDVEGRYWKPGVRGWSIAPLYTKAVDHALTLASPALQAHVMGEAQKLIRRRGLYAVTVGKFTEALAIAICVVALRERGL